MQDCATPLTQNAFAGVIRCHYVLESRVVLWANQDPFGSQVANPTQFDGDFNAEKEWYKHMSTPWDVMQLSPAQALTISCQSCGVEIAPSDATCMAALL